MQRAVNDTGDPAVKAYLKQQLAAYQHHLDPAAAQQTQKSANAVNRNLLRLVEGVRYEKLSAPAYAQGAVAATHLQAAYSSGNDLVIGMNALLGDLDWGPRTRAFEQAWADLARAIGFASQQPEHETGRGPDGLWAVAGGTFCVIEAKSGPKTTIRSTNPTPRSFRTRWTGSPLSTRQSRRRCPSWSIPARNSIRRQQSRTAARWSRRAS